MDQARIVALAERIEQFRGTIAAFEKTRRELQVRRCGATDHVMVEIDERLAVNARTLACLRRSLEVATLELKQARRRPVTVS